MLFDEAVYALTESLEKDSVATLRVVVDHGSNRAFYRAVRGLGVETVAGEERPTLTDALVALVEALE